MCLKGFHTILLIFSKEGNTIRICHIETCLSSMLKYHCTKNEKIRFGKLHFFYSVLSFVKAVNSKLILILFPNLDISLIQATFDIRASILGTLTWVCSNLILNKIKTSSRCNSILLIVSVSQFENNA